MQSRPALSSPALLPVSERVLGFHQTSTTPQLANAGGTWSRYAPRPRRPLTEPGMEYRFQL